MFFVFIRTLTFGTLTTRPHVLALLASAYESDQYYKLLPAEAPKHVALQEMCIMLHRRSFISLT